MVVRELWTYALVLNRRHWQEKPVFATLFTPRLGIVEARLSWSGTKRDALFRQSALEPMALSWFQLSLRASGASSEHWEPVELFSRLRTQQPIALLEISALIQGIIPQNEPLPELFNFALKTLKKGERKILNSPPILVEFTVGFLDLLGYGIEALMGRNKTDLKRLMVEEPETVFSVCHNVLTEALGIELFSAVGFSAGPPKEAKGDRRRW